MSQAVVELSGISKNYGALRPLRIETLKIDAGESVAILGLDQGASEMFINLVTGATLPDSGEIRSFGQATAGISDSDEWLTFVDRFGIISERAVLLDPLTAVQNIAVPFTLHIEPPPEDVRRQALELAAEVGLADSLLSKPVAELEPAARALVRAARALALNPGLLLIEHLSAGIPRQGVADLGRSIRAASKKRGAAAVTLTADAEFAAAISDRQLTHEPATGRLRAPGALGWLRGRLG